MQPSVCSGQVRIRRRGRRLLWGHWPWSHGRKALAALSPGVLQKPEPLEGWWRNVWTWEDVGAPSRANKAPAETSLETEKKVQLWSKALCLPGASSTVMRCSARRQKPNSLLQAGVPVSRGRRWGMQWARGAGGPPGVSALHSWLSRHKRI